MGDNLATMKRILVALDGSDRAQVVLGTATELAKRLGAKLVLLRVVGLPTTIDQEAVTHGESVLADSEEAAKTQLEAIRAAQPDVVEGMHVRLGVPWDAICHAATDLDADLVVIGSHGYKGVVDQILGTTAGKVVNHCDRSVLVARGRL
jgi:universal stress protein F